MRQPIPSAIGPLLVCAVLAAAALSAQEPPPAESSPAGLDTAAIERLTGLKGELNAREGVFRVSAPRSDLAVRVGGVRMTPRLGLSSWAAFRRAGAAAMVMGDLVLLEGEVDPVMGAALDAGLEVTALHNHFLGESPRVMFLHVGGHGPLAELAGAVGKVFRALEQARGRELKRAEIDPARTALDPAPIETALGAKGELKDGVLRVTIGKPARMHGEELGAAMGVNTWAAFAGDERQAVVDGDFAMYEPELQIVLQGLRKVGISVVAIHHHMTGEEPRVVFLHYWATGPALELAAGLRAVLDAQAGAAPRAAGAPADAAAATP